MPIDTRILNAQNYAKALEVRAEAPEYEQVWALNVLTHGETQRVLDNFGRNGDAVDVAGALGRVQQMHRDQDPTALFSEEFREALRHEDYDDYLVGKAREFADGSNSPIGFVGRAYRYNVDRNTFGGIRDDVMEEMGDEHRELYRRFLEARRNSEVAERIDRGEDDPTQDILPDGFDYEATKKFLAENEEWAKQVHEKAWWRSRDKDKVDAYMADLRSRNFPLLLSAVKGELSPQGASILDSCAEHGYEWDDSRWNDFRALPKDEQRKIVAAVLSMKRPKDAGFIVQSLHSVWDMVSGMGDSVWDTAVSAAALFTDRDYQDVSEERAFRRQLLEEKFKDLGFLGNTAVEAFGIAGYGLGGKLASMPLAKAGEWISAAGVARGAAALKAGASAEEVFNATSRALATGRALATTGAKFSRIGAFAMDTQRQYLERIHEQGGRVDSLGVQVMSWSVAVASAMVEEIQWETAWGANGLARAQADAYSKIVHSLFGKIAAKYGIVAPGVSLGGALATAGAEMARGIFFESAEEAIQQTMEEVVVQVGTGKDLDLGAAMAQGADAFLQSLGPMALTMVVGMPARAYSAAAVPFYGKEGGSALLSAGEKIVEQMRGRTWDPRAAGNESQGRAMNAISGAFARWIRAENDSDALGLLMRMGLAQDDALKLHGVFNGIRREAAEI